MRVPLVLLLMLCGCSGRSSVPATPKPADPAAAGSAKSIGEARMKDDGTVVLTLRADGPGKTVGDALLEYKRDHPQYQKVLEHLGGLKPGERKPIPPWPDEAGTP